MNLDSEMTVWLPRPKDVTVWSGISDDPYILGKEAIRFAGKVSDLIWVAERLLDAVKNRIEHETVEVVK